MALMPQVQQWADDLQRDFLRTAGLDDAAPHVRHARVGAPEVQFDPVDVALLLGGEHALELGERRVAGAARVGRGGIFQRTRRRLDDIRVERPRLLHRRQMRLRQLLRRERLLRQPVARLGDSEVGEFRHHSITLGTTK